MLLSKKNKMVLLCCFLFVVPVAAQAENCQINKSNIYAGDTVDATCKQLILPEISVEKGEKIDFACTIGDKKRGYGIDNDYIVIIGDVRMDHSLDQQNNYKFKTEHYYDRTKSFSITKTAKIHATINNLKFIFKDKKFDKVHISCEYNL